jgi:tetratricopeptide (TPR) repeat protein
LRAKPALILLGQIGCIIGAFAAVICLQLPQLAALKQPNKLLSKAELQAQESRVKEQFVIAKVMPAFGFDNILADWHFMNFLQYFGDTAMRNRAGYTVALDYFEVILDRDPRFLYAYYYLSNTGSLYAGQPERSVSLMTQGLKSFTPQVPDRGYYIWRLKAVDELLFLGKVPDARKSMLTAADWAKQYPDPESQSAARISQNTANYLARNPNSKQAQFDAWNMVLTAAVDKPVIDRAIAEIRSLGGNVTVSPTGEFKVEAPSKD